MSLGSYRLLRMQNINIKKIYLFPSKIKLQNKYFRQYQPHNWQQHHSIEFILRHQKNQSRQKGTNRKPFHQKSKFKMVFHLLPRQRYRSRRVLLDSSQFVDHFKGVRFFLRLSRVVTFVIKSKVTVRAAGNRTSKTFTKTLNWW